MTTKSCGTCQFWEGGVCEACEQHYVPTTADQGSDCGMYQPIAPTPPAPALECDRCGHVMLARNCKVECRNCGRIIDCSDMA